MREKLQKYCQTEILNGLRQCNEKQQLMFKRMYSHDNLELSIDDVVKKMFSDQLETAMEQVDRTLVMNKTGIRGAG